MKPSSTRWLNRLLFLMILAAVAAYVYMNLDRLCNMEFRPAWGYVALAAASVILGHLGNMAIWSDIAESSGFGTGFLRNSIAWVLSRLGRYVPGKVALLITRFRLYPGASKRDLTMATLLEYLSSLAATCVIFIIALLIFPAISAGYYLVVALTSLVVLAALLHPSVIRRLANSMLRKLGREPIRYYPPFRAILKYIFAYLFPVLFHGLGFFLLLSALNPLPIGYYIPITGVYYASALVGMAAVFAPSGIGVREGVMLLVMPVFISVEYVILGAIMIRLVTTADEIALALAASLLWRKLNPRAYEMVTENGCS